MPRFSIWKWWFKRTIKPDGWEWLERVKAIVEIAAIFIAGWWAYTLFIQADAPSLNLRVNLQGNLIWHKISQDKCEAEYEVEFHNIGKKSVEVERVCLSVWNLTELNEPTQGAKVTMLDPMRMRTEPALLKQCTDRLAHRYEPDERDKHGFSFIVQKSPGKTMLFQVDISGKAGEQLGAWTDYRWDYVCEENPNAPDASQ